MNPNSHRQPAHGLNQNGHHHPPHFNRSGPSNALPIPISPTFNGPAQWGQQQQGMHQNSHINAQNNFHQSHGSWQGHLQNQQPAPLPLLNGMNAPPNMNQGMPGNANAFPPPSALNPEISAQLLQEALKLTAPVGSLPDDDTRLAQVLFDTIKNGKSYRVAIESLHGYNNHAAVLWKDYYLDQKTHIDRLVSKLAEKPSQNTEKPSVTADKPAEKRPAEKIADKSSQSASTSSKKPAKAPQPKAVAKPVVAAVAPPRIIKQEYIPIPIPRRNSTQSSSTSKATLPAALTGAARRRTLNSLTTDAPLYDSRMPPPHSEIQIPKPPSREPTPPTEIITSNKGHKYTDADKKFFITFISWHLDKDPELSKQDLCQMLAEKAPHHTAPSWASHWHGNHDLPDKILAAAGERADAQNGFSDADAEGSVVEESPRRRAPAKTKPKPKYVESSSNSDSSSGLESSSEDEESDVEDFSSEEDIKNMGQPGSSFNDCDKRVLARYIAGVKDWEELSGRERFESFGEKHKMRSWKSWNEYYRREHKNIDKLVKVFKKRNKERAAGISSTQKPLQSQRARPAWATSKTAAESAAPPNKRKFMARSENEGDDPERGKRIKEEGMLTVYA